MTRWNPRRRHHHQPHPRRPKSVDPHSLTLRFVAFRNRASRISWGITGALTVCGSLLLALPSFDESPPVPRPWSLWLSTNAPTGGGLDEPNWLLNMTIVADKDCRTATVIGSLQWRIKELDSVVSPQPNRYILGVEGTKVLSFESRDIDEAEPRFTQQWHSTAMSSTEGANVVEIPAPFWPNSLERAEFRLKVTAVRPAGFHSCYLTSPGIGGPAEEIGPRPEPPIRSVIQTFVVAHHSPENLTDQIALDAVMEMAVPGQEPEAAVDSAAVASQPAGAVTTCSTHETGGLTVEGEIDRFAEYRKNRANRPCAGVQRFQSRNLQATLTKHTYISGILLSAGMVMFLDALMGTTAAVASRARRKTKRGSSRR
jgi:hypothetical protein